jgi:hypothetical protein
MKEEDTLFTKYWPTRGMNIHIYNYLKHNICLTKTKIQLHILITNEGGTIKVPVYIFNKIENSFNI